jgi:hypothetical protein
MASLSKHMRWPAIISGLFCATIISAVLWGNMRTPPSNNARLPLRNYVFRLAPQTREVFFDQMTLYAEVHGFTIHIGATDPQNVGYNVVLERADVEVIGANPWEPLAFDMGLYTQPGSNVPDSVLDALVADFQQTVEKIPGARTLKNLQDLSGCSPSINPCGPNY